MMAAHSHQADETASLTIDIESSTEDLSNLDEDILKIIESIPDRTIRPGRIAAELGISIEDASAELSGLLAAVGGGADGATFRFERVGGTNTMVFSFPVDFRRRALRKRRSEDFKQSLKKMTVIFVKVLKIVTAFGLIISLLIVSVAAVIGIVAAIIALSRAGGDHRQRSALHHQLRSVFYSVRQLLWFYALFGPENNENGGDPFLKEIAYDLWLFFSICCGNPASIFFWMRASHFRNRRGTGRRWSTLFESTNSGIPGVTLVGDAIEQQQSGSHRGLLSVAVEFLFGPTPFTPKPTESDIWVLRAHVLMNLSQSSGGGVALQSIAPYVDHPPSSLADHGTLVEQGMMIVAHFHGSPGDQESYDDSTISERRFIFPELMAESSHVSTRGFQWTEENDDNSSWHDVLYLKETAQERILYTIPKYLKESTYKLTRLSMKQMTHCCVLGALNLVGVFWLQQSLGTGGVLAVPPETFLASFLLKGLMPVLKFYALLFWALPLGRLGLISVFNAQRHNRNKKRVLLAEGLLLTSS